MSEYKEIQETVEVPPRTGVEGFLAVMRKILRLGRVQSVHIDATGKITYTRFVREDEPKNTIEMDFDTVSPGALVRNVEMEELDVFDRLDNAAVCFMAMFRAAGVDHMFPIAFVGGANSVVGEWCKKTTGFEISKDTLFGLPFHRDRFIPDETLILVTAYSYDAGLLDAKKTYKIAMPGRQAPERMFQVEGEPVDPAEAPALAETAEIPSGDTVQVIE